MKDTSKFDLLPAFISNQTRKRTVVYIGQSGTSGYASAAKGYVYDLIQKKIPVHYIEFETTNVYKNTHESFLTPAKKIILSNPTEIIIHSIPTGWDQLLINSKTNYDNNTVIVGRTVWEFNKLIPEWIDAINNSKVTVVSVPTEWNKKVFIESGVQKPIVVEPHIYIDYNYQLCPLNYLLLKSVVFAKTEVNTNELESYYKFYCIAQFIHRKGIVDTIEAFCKAFTAKDKVIFILKTFRNNYSVEEQIEIAKALQCISDRYNHAPIIFLKEELSFDEVKSLHYYGDCYFSLTKTEGFGLGIFEAFNLKKKIIVTGYGGHTEYLSKKCDHLIPFKLVDVNTEIYKNCYLDKTYTWASADQNIAVKTLQSVFLDQNKRDIKIDEEQLSILYVGQYGTSGYATAAKQYIADYVMRSIPIRWEPLYFDESKLDDDNYVNIIAKSAINKKINEYNTVILHCTPDLWPKYIKENKQKLLNKRLIGYTVWETSMLKPEWSEYINMVSEVWCPSTYNKKIFENSGVTVPIKVVPHLFFKNNLPNKSSVSINGAINNYYTFYNISELTERKNVKELLECYCQTFTKSDKVQLIIKIHYKNYNKINKSYCQKEINLILKKYPDHAHIVVLYDNLSDQELLALHAYSDCYITLTRSEGFGLTIFDAYNYGKQIIATGYSGYIDFLGTDYEGLIDYTLVNVDGMKNFNNNYNHSGQLWAQPNMQHFRQLIRNSYENKL